MLCGKTLEDNVSNYKIREMTGVESIDEFLREQRLQWLGRVERMDKESGPAKTLHFNLDGTKTHRPKKRWKEVVEQDMTARGLQRINAQDCTQWRLRCKNRLIPACREDLSGSKRRKKTNLHSGAK